MNRDRTEICNIISEMLDNPDRHGIYPTSTAYTRLEHYIEQERMRTLGWAHAWACSTLDNDDDPRTEEVPAMIEKARAQLSHD